MEAGLRDITPVLSGALAFSRMLEGGRHSLGTDWLEVGYDGTGLEDCVCTVSCGLEETGLRHPASLGSALTTWFSAFSKADKKSIPVSQGASRLCQEHSKALFSGSHWGLQSPRGRQGKSIPGHREPKAPHKVTHLLASSVTC